MALNVNGNSAMADHVWEWMGTTCVNCRLTPTEIAERGHTNCTAYVPDRFDTADDFAHIDSVTKSMAKGQ